MKRVSTLGTLFAALLWTTGVYGGQGGSSRAFCDESGGTVQETGDRDLHICCYPAVRRCVAVNDRSRSSVPVRFPEDAGDALSDLDSAQLGH